MRKPIAGEWIMAEALDPALPMTVTSIGGSPKPFASLERAVKKALSDAGLPNAKPDIRSSALDALRDAYATNSSIERELPEAQGLWIFGVPVPGPCDTAPAVQGWIGRPDEHEPPKLRPAAGVAWDYNKKMIIQPIESIRLSGVPDAEYVREVSLAEIIERGENVGQVTELLDFTQTPPVAGKSLQFQVNVPHSAGHVMRWQVNIRSRNDDQAQGSWWMWEDVTSSENQPAYATLEDIGYRAAHRRAGIYIAVLHPESATIPHWITDPAPWVKWRYLRHPSDVFHPHDRPRIRALAAAADRTDEIVVATLLPGLGYSRSRLLLTPYPGLTGNRQLMIAQIERESDPRERIPLEPDFRPGYVEQEEHFKRRHGGDTPHGESDV